MEHTEKMSVEAVRMVLSRMAREEQVSPDLVNTARITLEEMSRDAAVHGLTEADVLRAVISPVFEERRGCDCPTCKARREWLEEETLQPCAVQAC